jgi:DNA-binding response OmpR family regulator
MAQPRVLLVDDDPSIMRVLELNFRLAGFIVETAGLAADALEMAAAEPPDAVVLDVTLPDGSGIDTGARIRALPTSPEVPVVFLTGRYLPEAPDEVADADVISKPFDPADVVEVVRSRLGPSGAETSR